MIGATIVKVLANLFFIYFLYQHQESTSFRDDMSKTTKSPYVTQLFSHRPLNQDPEIYWDWNNTRVDAEDIAKRIKQHQPNFVWGTATAAHQVEGNNTNNWSEWEKIPGKIKNGDKSGPACEHYTRYKEDIQLMKQLGVRSYRFSVEWSRIQPAKQRGVFNAEATQHYHNVIDELLRNGITPMITLHHFTNPIWFQEMGEFRYGDNIFWFEEFAEYVFRQYSGKVKLWCTFNEVMMYTLGGNVAAEFPPGRSIMLQVAVDTTLNMIKAHTSIYHKLKSLPNGKDCLIGHVKDYMQFDPVPSDNLLASGICKLIEKVMNELILDYFETGHMELHIPFIVDVNYTNPLGKTSNDLIGLNY